MIYLNVIVKYKQEISLKIDIRLHFNLENYFYRYGCLLHLITSKEDRDTDICVQSKRVCYMNCFIPSSTA